MTTSPSWLVDALAELDRGGLRRGRRVVVPLPGGRCRVDGRELLNFATNDYLDLAGDERLAAAARNALEAAGTGARAGALVCGRGDWHARLEERIADFEGEQAALLFPTGYAANTGTLAALIEPRDVVLCDRLNHASLIDGVKLSGAKFRVYRHSRLDVLKRELGNARRSPGADDRRIWIVTDSVFSMDGDLAPLPDLCDLADEFDAALIVDEAHGTGVLGAKGRGVCELLNVEDRVAVRIGTLSKAVGCLGGFVAGGRDLVDWLWNSARTQVFSTALPPTVCAAATAAFDAIESSPDRREKLHRLARRLRDRFQEAGLTTQPVPTTGATGEAAAACTTPIVPVIIGDPDSAVQASNRLQERGFLVPAIRPPTVPRGTSRLRISLTCGHEDEDVDALANAVAGEIRGANSEV